VKGDDDMTTATVKETDVNIDRIAAEAQQRLSELREQQQRLSLDALTDKDAAIELRNIESEIASAEAELHRVGLARQEGERREADAAEKAEQERIGRLLRKAEALHRKIDAAAKRYDDAADELAQAHVAHHLLMVEQTTALTEAGAAEPGRPWGWISAYSGALAHALLSADPDKGSGRGSGIVGAYTTGSHGAPKPLAKPAEKTTEKEVN
jgi:hypothetical protein